MLHLLLNRLLLVVLPDCLFFFPCCSLHATLADSLVCSGAFVLSLAPVLSSTAAILLFCRFARIYYVISSSQMLRQMWARPVTGDRSSNEKKSTLPHSMDGLNVNKANAKKSTPAGPPVTRPLIQKLVKFEFKVTIPCKMIKWISGNESIPGRAFNGVKGIHLTCISNVKLALRPDEKGSI